MTDGFLITCLGCHLYESRLDESDARWLKNRHDEQSGCLAAIRKVPFDD
jgi:hypothetical protein